MPSKINAASVAMPQVRLTEEAWRQLQLMLMNDFTLQGKWFRVLISGKGCDGFRYSTGFTDLHPDDLKVQVTGHGANEEFMLAMDLFTAFYLSDVTIDYVQETENEGFSVINHLQKRYEGKFWRENEQLVPPTVSVP